MFTPLENSTDELRGKISSLHNIPSIEPSSSLTGLVKGVDYIGLAVVYFCHDGKGNFVMHKRGKEARDENGKWDVGAGSMELGDSADKTLKKEIKEEYGANVLKYEFLGFRDDMKRIHNGKPIHWVTLDFKVLVDPIQVKNGEPHKFEDVKWYTRETIPQKEFLHSQLLVFLEKYKDQLWQAD